MTYIVNKTDGSVLAEIVDGTIDQTSTDLTLIGKNSSNYGEFYNENLVHLLENFASTSQPTSPIAGQCWFDLNDNRLKVFDGTAFKVSGGTIVSNIKPTTLASGDIWIDSVNNQLKFQIGSTTHLAGPSYTAIQGATGYIPKDIVGTDGVVRTVALMYVGGTLLGAFSSAAFTIRSDQAESSSFTGSLNIGFTASNYAGLSSSLPASQASTLVAADGSLKIAENFVWTVGDSTILGKLSIQSNTPLVLGTGIASGLIEMNLTGSAYQINSNAIGQNFQLNLLNNSGVKPAVFANASSEYVGIYTATPAATLDVNGSTIIRGDLTVEGNLTSIETTNIEISDKLLVISKTASPSNTTANGAGFLVPAGVDGDKSFTWDSTNDSWQLSSNANIPAGTSYNIGNSPIISETTIASTVSSAAGLTTVGHLTKVQVADLAINVTGSESSTIRFYNQTVTDGTINLLPKGTGTVDVSNHRITSVADPNNSTDAANRNYVDTVIKYAPLGLVSDTTGLTNAQIGSQIIGAVFPESEHLENTTCRIQCIDTGVRTNKLYRIIVGAWTFQYNY